MGVLSRGCRGGWRTVGWTAAADGGDVIVIVIVIVDVERRLRPKEGGKGRIFRSFFFGGWRESKKIKLNLRCDFESFVRCLK